MSYQTKVYHAQGGDEVVVADGGTITVQSGGAVVVESGGALGQQDAEADLDQTISGSPTQAEVQAISDKVDALLAKLRLAGILATE